LNSPGNGLDAVDFEQVGALREDGEEIGEAGLGGIGCKVGKPLRTVPASSLGILDEVRCGEAFGPSPGAGEWKIREDAGWSAIGGIDLEPDGIPAGLEGDYLGDPPGLGGNQERGQS